VVLAGFGLIAVGLVALPSLPARGIQRVHFTPKFTPGETLRYQIEVTTKSSAKMTTPIANPEGGSEFSQTIRMLVRLEVVSVQPTTPPAPPAPNAPPGAPSAAGAVRLRATYEKSHAESQTDAVNPGAPSPDDPYNRLEGHSIEFTLDPNGRLSDFQGLEDIFPTRSEADPTLSWLKGLSLGSGFPAEGVAVGQKWRNEHPLAGAPLAGLMWRAESTYLRNEPCSAGENAPTLSPAASADTCAIILTRFEIFRRGGAHSDATPEDYRRNGLRTSGTWTGSGESLDSISLASGFLVSSSGSSTQSVDYEITSAVSGSAIHQVGHTESDSEIKLLPDSRQNLP